jgi:hypothetical protein
VLRCCHRCVNLAPERETVFGRRCAAWAAGRLATTPTAARPIQLGYDIYGIVTFEEELWKEIK